LKSKEKEDEPGTGARGRTISRKIHPLPVEALKLGSDFEKGGGGQERLVNVLI